MKQIILSIASLLALSIMAGAQTTYESDDVTRHWDGTKTTSHSSVTVHDYTAERREALEEHRQALEEARQQAQQQAAYAALKAQEQADYEQRWQAAIAAQNARHYRAVEIDDDGKLISYIKAQGYTQVTPIMIDRLRQYMSDNHLLHVSELP